VSDHERTIVRTSAGTLRLLAQRAKRTGKNTIADPCPRTNWRDVSDDYDELQGNYLETAAVGKLGQFADHLYLSNAGNVRMPVEGHGQAEAVGVAITSASRTEPPGWLRLWPLLSLLLRLHRERKEGVGSDD